MSGIIFQPDTGFFSVSADICMGVSDLAGREPRYGKFDDGEGSLNETCCFFDCLKREAGVVSTQISYTSQGGGLGDMTLTIPDSLLESPSAPGAFWRSLKVVLNSGSETSIVARHIAGGCIRLLSGCSGDTEELEPEVGCFLSSFSPYVPGERAFFCREEYFRAVVVSSILIWAWAFPESEWENNVGGSFSQSKVEGMLFDKDVSLRLRIHGIPGSERQTPTFLFEVVEGRHTHQVEIRIGDGCQSIRERAAEIISTVLSFRAKGPEEGRCPPEVSGEARFGHLDDGRQQNQAV